MKDEAAKPSLAYRLWCRLVFTAGHAMLMPRPPLVTGEQLRCFERTARFGDVVFRSARWTLAYCLVPGPYVHSAVIVSSTEVVHAVSGGVSREDVLGFGQWQDDLCIFRPEYPAQEAKDLVVQQAEAFLGTPYDALFWPGSKRLYCHEFTARCLAAGGLMVPDLGRVITARSILSLPGEVVWRANR